MKTTITKYGDRWDLIAYDLLGDAALVGALMSANPKLVSIYEDHLPEGVEIRLPNVYVEQNQITKVRAPWKD